MTQDFRETKIEILSEEHSRAFQEAVFEAGGRWHSAEVVKYLSAKFLFVDADLNLGYEVWDRDYFDCHKFTEIQFPLPTKGHAAPAQKVTFDEDEALSLAERTFSTEIGEQLASDVIQYARRLHNKYTAPQPETLPSTKCPGASCMDQGCPAHYANDYQPTPDVAKLVEALEQVIKAAPSSGPLWHGSEQIVEARKALTPIND